MPMSTLGGFLGDQFERKHDGKHPNVSSVVLLSIAVPLKLLSRSLCHGIGWQNRCLSRNMQEWGTKSTCVLLSMFLQFRPC